MICGRYATAVKGNGASVLKTNVSVNGAESEYVGGADIWTVTCGVRGREERTVKGIVSFLFGASHVMGTVENAGIVAVMVVEALDEFVRAFEALAGQQEIELVGLKDNLYFRPALKPANSSGNSYASRFPQVVN